jgi:sigma-B regulation protein RsbU (phosphoserine phosphatase)
LRLDGTQPGLPDVASPRDATNQRWLAGPQLAGRPGGVPLARHLITGLHMSTSADTARVLVADDQSDVRMALHLLMRDAGLESDGARNVDEVRRMLASGSYDLLLLDLNYTRDTTSGREGLELLAEVHAQDPLLPVVVMTGWGSVEMAVEAMRRGARSFVHKPWDNASLSAAIRREVADGRAARRAERRAVREQADAQAMQRALLPSCLPRIAGCELAARWTPASAFGGDCYDVIRLSETRLAISVADVCGKGLPAALLMSSLQASMRAFASQDATPVRLVANVNGALVRNEGLRRFVTCFYAVYDTDTRELTFVNAGHNPPLVVSADGSVGRLSTGGMVLGVFEAAGFEQERVRLERGDRIVLFTDGIVEAENPAGDDFGDSRLTDVVVRRRDANAAALIDGIFGQVTRFTAGPLQDDATVVVLAVE